MSHKIFLTSRDDFFDYLNLNNNLHADDYNKVMND